LVNNTRVGIIGLGKMGLLHASIINTLPNVELSMFCDRGTIVRKFVGKMFNSIQITDEVKKLRKSDLDVAYVTTPIPTHFPIMKEIYTEDVARNVFVEKTLTSSYKESKELIGLARDSGGINMVGYMQRYAVTFRKAKDLMDKGSIGRIVSFDAYAYSSDFFGGTRKGTSRGGVLRDTGSHIIDMALWYFRDLRVEVATLHPSSFGNEDSAELVVKTPDGLKGNLKISWCQSGYRMPEFGLSVLGTEGSIIVNNDEVRLQLNNERTSIWYRQDLNDNVKFLLGGPEYYREDEQFFKSILNKGHADPDFENGSRVEFFLGQINGDV